MQTVDCDAMVEQADTGTRFFRIKGAGSESAPATPGWIHDQTQENKCRLLAAHKNQRSNNFAFVAMCDTVVREPRSSSRGSYRHRYRETAMSIAGTRGYRTDKPAHRCLDRPCLSVSRVMVLGLSPAAEIDGRIMFSVTAWDTSITVSA
jgi:hypothetical protein